MPLVENLARKFSTAQQASGVMNINDLIQEGNKNLTGYYLTGCNTFEGPLGPSGVIAKSD